MFELDARLQADTLLVGDFKLCRLLLMNDNHYPWFILVPKRRNLTEVFQLKTEDQEQMWREVSAFAETLKDTFNVEKINIASLGNVVSQLHIHVIGRKTTDAAWPGPVWGKVEAQAYSAEQMKVVCEKLRMALTENFEFLNKVAQ